MFLRTAKALVLAVLLSLIGYQALRVENLEKRVQQLERETRPHTELIEIAR